jgi:uncharacterized protein (TIGR03084 family)
MDAIIDDLAAQHAELRSLVERCTEDDWSRQTPCEGWDVADVLLHLVQTDELAVASARGELDRFRNGFLGTRDETSLSVDAAAAAQVEVERGIGGAAITARWEQSSASLLAELRAGDPHRRVMWIAGQLSLHTLAATRLAESWIHTGDIATALGVELAPTNRLRHVTRLAWRTLPYAFAKAGLELGGPVALDLVGPDGDRWHFAPDAPETTTIRGSASEFCELAARRLTPPETSLVGEGPDAAMVLQLVRTYAQ